MPIAPPHPHRDAAASFGHADTLPQPFDSGLHAHAHHQLLYSAEGTLRLEAADGAWLLPPRRAAWLGAGVAHRVTAARGAALRTVYLSPALPLCPSSACAVFDVGALAVELILHMTARGAAPEPSAQAEAVRAQVAAAIAALCVEWAARPHPWRLPTAQTPALQAALDATLRRLDQPLTLADVAKAAGMSLRTATRHLSAELGMGWRDYLHHARMLHAMTALDHPSARVTDVAVAVGFDSLAAFAQAFKRVTGQTPSQYQRDLRRPQSASL